MDLAAAVTKQSRRTMKITLIQDATIEVEEYPSVDSLPDDTTFEREPVITHEDYKKGQMFDGDVIDDFGDYVNFEFEDGSRTYNLYKNLYEVTP